MVLLVKPKDCGHNSPGRGPSKHPPPWRVTKTDHLCVGMLGEEKQSIIPRPPMGFQVPSPRRFHGSSVRRTLLEGRLGDHLQSLLGASGCWSLCLYHLFPTTKVATNQPKSETKVHELRLPLRWQPTNQQEVTPKSMNFASESRPTERTSPGTPSEPLRLAAPGAPGSPRRSSGATCVASAKMPRGPGDKKQILELS